MPIDLQHPIKQLLRGAVRSTPVRHFSRWLNADPGNISSQSQAKLCFVHIPKTGGSFVGQTENSNEAIVFPIRNLGHSTLVNENWELICDVPPPYGRESAVPLSTLDGHVVFSNVRNPFSFLVSYLHHAGGHVGGYHDPHHYDFSIANKSFDYLIKTICDRDSVWPSRKFIHYQLFSQPSGVSIVNWINCTATLDRDLHAMAQHFSVGLRAGKPQRGGLRVDYRRYYTDVLADIVSKTWSREIELFGFQFDQPQSRYSPLELAERARSTRYFLRDDRFVR